MAARLAAAWFSPVDKWRIASSSTGSPAKFPSSKARSADNAGFTLLEFLVAFTIAVMLLFTFYRLMGGDLKDSAAADAVTRATLLAQSKMEAIGVTEPLAPGIARGRIDDDFSWRVEVAPWASDGGQASRPSRPTPKGYEVRVTVSWHDGENQRSVSLDSLRLSH